MKQPSGSMKVCPECGAQSSATSARCWICRSDLKNVQAIVLAEAMAPSIKPQSWASPTIRRANAAMIASLFFVVVVVGIGVGLVEKWLLFPYLIVVIPAWIVFWNAAEAKSLNRKRVGPADIFISFVLSLAGVVGVLILLILALFIAIFAICAATGPHRI